MFRRIRLAWYVSWNRLMITPTFSVKKSTRSPSQTYFRLSRLKSREKKLSRCRSNCGNSRWNPILVHLQVFKNNSIPLSRYGVSKFTLNSSASLCMCETRKLKWVTENLNFVSKWAMKFFSHCNTLISVIGRHALTLRVARSDVLLLLFHVLQGITYTKYWIDSSPIFAVHLRVRVHLWNRERRSVHPFILEIMYRSVHRSVKMNAVLCTYASFSSSANKL